MIRFFLVTFYLIIFIPFILSIPNTIPQIAPVTCPRWDIPSFFLSRRFIISSTTKNKIINTTVIGIFPDSIFTKEHNTISIYALPLAPRILFLLNIRLIIPIINEVNIIIIKRFKDPYFSSINGPINNIFKKLLYK